MNLIKKELNDHPESITKKAESMIKKIDAGKRDVYL
jgi:hypothetical protein